MKAIGELGSQISDVIRTEGSIYAYNEAQKVHPNFSADELKQTQEYKDAMKDYGTGGTYQKAAQAITAALQGLAGNNLEQALTGASSPYVAGIIKQMTEKNEPAHIMAHAVWGAIVANAKDSNAVAGAIGAATAEGLAPYIQQALYGDRKVSELTEEEKQTITALATIGAGLAGSFGSDGNFASGVAAAEMGKNAVENNNFDVSGFGQGTIDTASQVKAAVECYNKGECSEEEMDEIIKDSSVQKVPYDPANSYVFLWAMTGDNVASMILATEGWIGAVLGWAWAGGSFSATEQQVTTGKIDLDELELSAGVGGLTGGVGKGVIKLGGKGVSYLTGGSKVVEDTNPSWLLNIGGRGDGDFGQLGLTLDDLSTAALSPNRNGLTGAGRALQKHSGRTDSVFTATNKKASTLNQEGQQIVNDILKNPNSQIIKRAVQENGKSINVIDVYAPDGRGLRFTADGKRFIGLREP